MQVQAHRVVFRIRGKPWLDREAARQRKCAAALGELADRVECPYCAKLADMSRLAADYVDCIAKGAKSREELVVNALGIEIPTEILARDNEVIE